MTNEEAKKYFRYHIDNYCVTGVCRDAEEKAIKVITDLDSLKNQIAIAHKNIKSENADWLKGYKCALSDIWHKIDEAEAEQ